MFFLLSDFPEPSQLLKKYPRLEGYLYLQLAPSSLFWIPQYRSGFRSDDPPAFQYAAFTWISVVAAIAYITGGLLSLLTNYRGRACLSGGCAWSESL